MVAYKYFLKQEIKKSRINGISKRNEGNVLEHITNTDIGTKVMHT